VEPFYAVKSNPNPRVLQTLYSKGVNFDCASLREMYNVSDLNEPGELEKPDIIYAHPLKSDNDIRMINDMKIQTTVVDSVEECDKLSQLGWKGSAFLRVAVGDKASRMPFSMKFGATRDEVHEIARWSKIPLTGVSFHVGSGCEDPTQYASAIEYSVGYVFDTLKINGHQPRVIDIGGGFSGEQSKFQQAADVIRNTLNTIPETIKVIAEPGRYFAQPSQDLFVKVIAKKPGRTGWRYVIDESLYGQFSCIPFDHQRPAWFRVAMSDNAKPREKSDAILFGRTCDSLDVIARGEMETLEVGDWLYFPLMGAYTAATASEFNGFPKPYSMEDIDNLLPNTEHAYGMSEHFHSTQVLKYSNTLEPIV
jgi:ornithine decarboxylase